MTSHYAINHFWLSMYYFVKNLLEPIFVSKKTVRCLSLEPWFLSDSNVRNKSEHWGSEDLRTLGYQQAQEDVRI